MNPPSETPIGLDLARTAKLVSRSFAEALEAAGGSLAAWLILRSLKAERLNNQRELAEQVGIRGATLTHHLNAMEGEGLVTRRRDPANRRIHLVEITVEGEARFRAMRTAAIAYDEHLRAGLSETQLASLRALLHRLRANVADPSASPERSHA
ncbi:MAG: MarR family winged helix-turn-helix transcriptional regulator [Gemmatimonadaceae bacterium]